MSFVIDQTVTDKEAKTTVFSQFTGNNSIQTLKMFRIFVLIDFFSICSVETEGKRAGAVEGILKTK